MAEPEEEINEITESTRHALDQDADEELLPMSSTWERDLNAASKAPNVSVFERHTLDNKVFNKPVFSANTIKEVKTGEPQKPRADIILNALTNPAPTRLVGGPRGVLSCPLGRWQGRRRMRAAALKLFRKLNKYARVINYFCLLCHTCSSHVS